MVLMAIDHVRVYSGIPAGSHEPGIFLTRWITHFCAPGFAFLAGTAAFLYGQKLQDNNKLSRFLLSRGLLLVLLEVTLIRFSWTFNFEYGNFFLAGVIWMLGWCMVLMALLARLRPLLTGMIGIAIILFQQAFKFVPGIVPHSFRSSFGKFWEFTYPSGLQGLEGVTILYVIVPWIGVMASGYGFGLIMAMEQEKRHKFCKAIGLSAIAVFLVGAGLFTYFQPASADAPVFIFRFLNQNKYPPSQFFLLMTLGPIIACIPLAEKAKGWLSNVLSVFGRVPMFYYLLHIPIIHLSALLVTYFREGNVFPEWYATAPYTFLPDESRWGLPLLYLVFIIDVAILYFACKWYSRVKEQHPGSWLRFI